MRDFFLLFFFLHPPIELIALTERYDNVEIIHSLDTHSHRHRHINCSYPHSEVRAQSKEEKSTERRIYEKKKLFSYLYKIRVNVRYNSSLASVVA